MRFAIDVTMSAEIDLDAIRPFDRKQILDAVENFLRHDPTLKSRSRIKKLRSLKSPTYRLRVGDYRIFYDVDESTVTILRVLSKSASIEYLRRLGGHE